jgi:hypothetical protein
MEETSLVPTARLRDHNITKTIEVSVDFEHKTYKIHNSFIRPEEHSSPSCKMY